MQPRRVQTLDSDNKNKIGFLYQEILNTNPGFEIFHCFGRHVKPSSVLRLISLVGSATTSDTDSEGIENAPVLRTAWEMLRCTSVIVIFPAQFTHLFVQKDISIGIQFKFDLFVYTLSVAYRLKYSKK